MLLSLMQTWISNNCYLQLCSLIKDKIKLNLICIFLGVCNNFGILAYCFEYVQNSSVFLKFIKYRLHIRFPEGNSKNLGFIWKKKIYLDSQVNEFWLIGIKTFAPVPNMW